MDIESVIEDIEKLQEFSENQFEKFQSNFLAVRAAERLLEIIEEKQKREDDIYLGRSEYDAPDVDGVVYVRSKKKLESGDFVDIRVTDAYEYDLAGELHEPSE